MIPRTPPSTAAALPVRWPWRATLLSGAAVATLGRWMRPPADSRSVAATALIRSMQSAARLRRALYAVRDHWMGLGAGAWRAAAAVRASPLRGVVVAVACGIVSGAAAAQPVRLPEVPQAALAPRAGARLPLNARFASADGRSVTLGDYFGRVPVVLIPGYYACRNLCETTFQQAAQALALSGVTANDVRVLGLSIDPHEGPSIAAIQRGAYARLLPDGASLDLLTGSPASIASVTQALGYRFSRTPDGQFAHPAALVVARPDGRIARVFSGVQFDPHTLRAAILAAASADGQGAGHGLNAAGDAPATLGAQMLMLCAHFDPRIGRFTGAALTAVRAIALLAAAILAIFIWRRRSTP